MLRGALQASNGGTATGVSVPPRRRAVAPRRRRPRPPRRPPRRAPRPAPIRSAGRPHRCLAGNGGRRAPRRGRRGRPRPLPAVRRCRAAARRRMPAVGTSPAGAAARTPRTARPARGSTLRCHCPARPGTGRWRPRRPAHRSSPPGCGRRPTGSGSGASSPRGRTRAWSSCRGGAPPLPRPPDRGRVLGGRGVVGDQRTAAGRQSRTSITSLTAIGTPCSGPRKNPRAASRDSSSAWARAYSSSNATNARTAGSAARIRATARSKSSRGDDEPSRIRRAAERTVSGGGTPAPPRSRSGGAPADDRLIGTSSCRPRR